MTLKAPTLLLGHRGARGEAPENTLLGFQHTQSLGIDGVEFDIQLSKDGKLVVFHDDTLNRCVGQQGRVDQMNSAVLATMQQRKLTKELTATDNKLTKISLLSDVLPYLTGYQYIELEVKTHQRTDHDTLANALVQTLADIDRSLPIRLTSFDCKLHEALQRHDAVQRKKFPLTRGLLTEVTLTTSADTAQLIYTAKRLGCVGVAIHFTQLTEQRIKQLHAAKLSTTAWTVNDAEWVRNLRDWGVGAIITDYPSRFMHLTHR